MVNPFFRMTGRFHQFRKTSTIKPPKPSYYSILNLEETPATDEKQLMDVLIERNSNIKMAIEKYIKGSQKNKKLFRKRITNSRLKW